MPKRHRSSSSSSFALKRHRSSAELLPHDVVELILERLPAKSLRRFKSLSKQWKSTIESNRFQERQFIRGKQSRGPDVLFISLDFGETPRRFVFGSSTISTVNFPTGGCTVCYSSCDGLVCVHCIYKPSVVINPATGWHQHFPLCNFQQLKLKRGLKKDFTYPCHNLGLGKDKVTGTYKPVWLYNSAPFGLDNVTTCEVFDFTTNAWRYLTPASPLRITSQHDPMYLDGSLYWYTACQETKLLSLDLHTETFQVICKTPFPIPKSHRYNYSMCVLHNRLCFAELNWPKQVIWSFDSSGTWTKLCSINLTRLFSLLGQPPDEYTPIPIAIVDKTKLVLHGLEHDGLKHRQAMVIHDLRTKSYDFVFKPSTDGCCVPYYQSLFSALPN